MSKLSGKHCMLWYVPKRSNSDFLFAVTDSLFSTLCAYIKLSKFCQKPFSVFEDLNGLLLHNIDINVKAKIWDKC